MKHGNDMRNLRNSKNKIYRCKVCAAVSVGNYCIFCKDDQLKAGGVVVKPAIIVKKKRRPIYEST